MCVSFTTHNTGTDNDPQTRPEAQVRVTTTTTTTTAILDFLSDILSDHGAVDFSELKGKCCRCYNESVSYGNLFLVPRSLMAILTFWRSEETRNFLRSRHEYAAQLSPSPGITLADEAGATRQFDDLLSSYLVNNGLHMIPLPPLSLSYLVSLSFTPVYAFVSFSVFLFLTLSLYQSLYLACLPLALCSGFCSYVS